MKKSIKRNYVYNLVYQILVLITPLITTPYLSRVLGADGVGTLSFTESVVSYFTLFATFGMTTYGQREISYVQDSKDNRSNVFYETKILEFISTAIAVAVYLPFALCQNNSILYLIYGLNLLSVLANVTWFFQGMEEFGRIVARNIIFKLVNIAYIFAFVRQKDDLAIYAFGMAFFLLLSNLSLWVYLPKFIGAPNFKTIRPFRHILVIITLFIPTIAGQIYTVMDKTMIGIITKDSFENGYYEQASKISKMVLTIVTSLGTVMIPRIGYHFGRGETDKVNLYMYKAYRFVWFAGIPLSFGLVGVASNFVPWFFGDGYEKVIPLLSILGFLVIAIGLNNITGIQYLIPTKRQNLFTLTVFIGAGVNLLMNAILISRYQSIGAAIASVTAESAIALTQFWFIRKDISILKVFQSSKNYLFSGFAMLLVIKILGKQFLPSIFNTFLLVAIGGLLYLVLLILIKDSFLIENTSRIINKIKNH